MTSFHLHIKGQVQGVGFRPFIYRLAREMKLTGTVSNGSDGVHIYFNAYDGVAEEFCRELELQAPELSIIENYTLEEVSPSDFQDFTIVESNSEQEAGLKVSPDFGTCEACRHELKNPGNRRADYAFITCTHCGPRYSIMKTLPYDRPTTTMHGFDMCESCSAEYHDPENRRHHSQTNSCESCGISMSIYRDGELSDISDSDQIISQMVKSLGKGEIAAVKGIGGYLLLCDAANPEAIQTLRKRKHRAYKPFALLYPDLKALRQDVEVSRRAEGQLKSPASPIVLLPLNAAPGSQLALEDIAPGLSKLGVMLPYAPLLELIASQFGGPLVATSGNLNGSPIIFEDEQAVTELSRFADLILVHNRGIVVPQDDSVLRIAGDRSILLRRSRGFAPSYFGPVAQVENPQAVLAFGAHMKGSIALADRNNWHVSQYLGGLDGFESQESYKATLTHLLELFRFEPAQLLCDAHPGYFVNSVADSLVESHQLPVTRVQHHEAHFAAVLQENDLFNQPLPVLGVVWDGTGWGADGNVWGGEFFQYEAYGIERLAHLEYTAQLAGDKMAREPRLATLSFSSNHPGISRELKKLFTEQEWNFYQKALQRPTIQTSSIGRLFDAMAAILGLMDVNGYEGHAAILLEECATKATDYSGRGYVLRPEDDSLRIDHFLEELSDDLAAGIEPAVIALKFHLGLVNAIELVANSHGLSQIAFSGGVFQNALLVQLIEERLGDRFDLWFHKALPPNDENISFGQLAHFFMQQKRNEFLNQNKEQYVFSDTR